MPATSQLERPPHQPILVLSPHHQEAAVFFPPGLFHADLTLATAAAVTLPPRYRERPPRGLRQRAEIESLLPLREERPA
jgi:hypothetical protein